LASHSKKVLITGVNGFTGRYLAAELRARGFDVTGTARVPTDDSTIPLDVTNKNQISNVLKAVRPEFVFHLAAISFVAHSDPLEFYNVNVLGTENLLQAISESDLNIKKVLISSSANIYGNSNSGLISESVQPEPINHYACSKLVMEKVTANFFENVPIIITRPFNYTGAGQALHFLVPKIVSHFKDKRPILELGNLDVARDFSSVRFVVESYIRLMTSEVRSEIVNICSGKSHSLLEIVDFLKKVSGHNLKVVVNPNFVRKNEVKEITGDNKKLLSFFNDLEVINFYQTIKEMYEAD